MNETSTFRRAAATLTIGSFSLAALMGILALLGGGSFGDGEARVLLTTLIVGCASICALCYLATAGTPWAPVGVVGAVTLILPVATSLVLVWADWDLFDNDMDGTWKAFGIGVVAAVSLAQICLLLALAGNRESLRFVLWSTVGLAVLLAILVSGMILGEVDAGDVWRFIGVVAILDVLGTVVTIALAKFGGRREPERPGYTPNHLVRVTLSDAHAAAIEDLSRASGRPPADLVAEAVDRYLETAGSSGR
jgi:hypothetical protein